jgi:hypothetical protein
MTSHTESLLKLRHPGDAQLHTAVVYRTGFSVDENGDEDRMIGQWVVARGYEGGGIIGDHSCVCRYDEDFQESMIRSQSAYPELEDFILNDDHPFEPTEEDIRILNELWGELDRISSFDADSREFVSKLPVPEGQDAVMSDGWEADDLLESVSDGWQLFLKF